MNHLHQRPVSALTEINTTKEDEVFEILPTRVKCNRSITRKMNSVSGHNTPVQQERRL